MGIVVYAVAAGGRLSQIVAAVGAGGCALILLALASRWTAAFPFGVAGVGAAYAVYLALSNGAVEARAPAVAAALFIVAELGFWSLERSPSRSERAVLLRRLAGLVVGAVVTALAGSLILVLATGASGGVGLEAAGVAAAVLAVAAIARLAVRASV